MEFTGGALEELSEAIVGAFVPIGIVIAALAAFGLGLPVAICRFQRRSGSKGPRETLFVGRWGVLGPELYLVGENVHRLAGPPDQAQAALAFAQEMLASVMRCSPASRLAWAFAEAELEPLPPDGFVISRSEVEAWLDTRQRGQSSQVTP
jgi:hypothetical protein